MRILVTGANGQVGFELMRNLAPLGQVVGVDRQDLDLADASAVNELLNREEPQFIVNAAAYTAVDKAESEPEQAEAVNTRLPGLLAEWAREHEAGLIHFSTDYVYSGEGEQPWKETDPTGPTSVYGKTKLGGDEAVLSAHPDSLIFRTSWVYGARGHNFMKTMLRLGAEKEALTVVDDQVGAPTPAWLIAQTATLALYRKQIGGGELSGIYHLASADQTSWCGFASEIMRLALDHGVDLTIRPEAVRPIPTSDYPTPAPRPLNSRLDLSRLEESLGVTMPHWRDALVLTLQEWLDNTREGS